MIQEDATNNWPQILGQENLKAVQKNASGFWARPLGRLVDDLAVDMLESLIAN